MWFFFVPTAIGNYMLGLSLLPHLTLRYSFVKVHGLIISARLLVFLLSSDYAFILFVWVG